jgi:DNA-binding XRE family transcriptional regulator
MNFAEYTWRALNPYRKARLEKPMSRDELARATGFSKQCIYLNETRQPSERPSTVLAICNALGLDPLLTGPALQVWWELKP